MYRVHNNAPDSVFHYYTNEDSAQNDTEKNMYTVHDVLHPLNTSIVASLVWN